MASCVLIPAYKPDEKLLAVINELNALKNADTQIVVVDDGSKSDCKDIFEKAESMGCTVLVHPENRGKGAALKTGLNYAKKQNYTAVVTADADGQHTAKDIVNVLALSLQNPNALTLGVRNTKEMPPRSKFGNRLTSGVFKAVYGRYLCDTQTGLRGIPQSYYSAFAALDGDRYEYEMNMLIYCAKEKIPFAECKIDTVYIENNSSSHFKGLRDGFRIYALIFKQAGKFALTSFSAFLIDFTLFIVLNKALLLPLVVCVVGARAVSSLINFLLNRKFVFGQGGGFITNFLKYYLLVGVIIGLNYALMYLFVNVLCIDSVLAKIITELGLYILSYKVQQIFVFKGKRKND